MATTSTSKTSRDLQTSLKSLSLSQSKPAKYRTSRPVTPPETWEEEAEAVSTLSDSHPSTTTTSPHASGTTTPHEQSLPMPPPPTPMSPSHRRGKSTDWSAFHAHPLAAAAAAGSRSPPVTSPGASRRGTNEMEGKRPEKTTAAAGRMIAGALGVKTPKLGEEQRQYERAVREKEKKRKEREKAERGQVEREAEAAKRSVWEG